MCNGTCVQADVAVGAALVAGARTPVLVTKAMLESMKPGSVFVDVAIDQGGMTEMSRPTTHTNPVFKVCVWGEVEEGVGEGSRAGTGAVSTRVRHRLGCCRISRAHGRGVGVGVWGRGVSEESLGGGSGGRLCALQVFAHNTSALCLLPPTPFL